MALGRDEYCNNIVYSGIRKINNQIIDQKPLIQLSSIELGHLSTNLRRKRSLKTSELFYGRKSKCFIVKFKTQLLQFNARQPCFF